MENWYLYVVAMTVGVFIGGMGYKFFKLPTSEKLKDIKDVMFVLVEKAETLYLSGEGQKKLEYVYNEMIKRYNFIKIMPLDVFNVFVKGALIEVKIWLKKDSK